MRLTIILLTLAFGSLSLAQINSADSVKDPMSKTITNYNNQVVIDPGNPTQQITLQNNDIKMVSIFDHSHMTFDLVLKKYAREVGKTTLVNYKLLKENPSNLLEYIGELEAVSKEEFDSFTKDQQFVFWVNAYNAYTLKVIIDNYPVKSIMNIGFKGSKAWKTRFAKLAGRSRSLDDIEHKILRRQFNEPRLHFAVNCASISCPPLRTEPYMADQLEKQLTEQTRLYINDIKNNKFTIQDDKISLEISQIFEWFEKDFKRDGGVAAFVIKWLDISPETKTMLDTSKVRLKHIEYDWGLNESK